jgi:hypothetical protein
LSGAGSHLSVIVTDFAGNHQAPEEPTPSCERTLITRGLETKSVSILSPFAARNSVRRVNGWMVKAPAFSGVITRTRSMTGVQKPSSISSLDLSIPNWVSLTFRAV